MKKCFFFLLAALILIVTSCKSGADKKINKDEIATVKNLDKKQKNFIVSFYPGSADANQKILCVRQKILNLKRRYRNVMSSDDKLPWLNKITANYYLGDNFFNSDFSRNEFLKRIDSLLYYVDIIPDKLVMAQAIVESGWGKSKFAREINNYFGVHCYKPGCGVPPSGLSDAKFFVKSYPTIEAGVEDYLHILNTSYAYKKLRNTRASLREKLKTPEALPMAQGLGSYSAKGDEYITLLTSIINNYLPENLDAYVNYQESLPKK